MKDVWELPPNDRIRLIALVEQAVPQFSSPIYNSLVDDFGLPGSVKRPPDVRQWVVKTFRNVGVDIEADYGRSYDLRSLLEALSSDHFVFALQTVSKVLFDFDKLAGQQDMQAYRWIGCERFESLVNDILAGSKCPSRIRRFALVESGRDAAAILRKALLRGEGEPATCSNGDIQVEMVNSSVQMLLSKPGALIVDYGAGLGRVLQGLETADLFSQVNYLCVEEVPSRQLHELTQELGVGLQSREKFLASVDPAHAVIVVNTLHHMPFSDIPRQFNKMLNLLEDGGILLIHEMGSHPDPEPWNVPWEIQDIKMLLGVRGVTVNGRATESKRKVPLAHCIVSVQEKRDFTPDLKVQVQRVWQSMKTRAVESVAALYKAANESDEPELARKLAINANLDLNLPER